MKNRFVEYSKNQRWARCLDEDWYEYLLNPMDFDLIFYGTPDECRQIASSINREYAKLHPNNNAI